jgi:hypothetical protein
MPLDINDPQVRVAVFGEQVNQFMASDIGQYLLQCAQMDTDSAAAEMLDVDVTDAPAVMRIKIKLLVAARIESWLHEAIVKGYQAFTAEQSEELQ